MARSFVKSGGSSAWRACAVVVALCIVAVVSPAGAQQPAATQSERRWLLLSDIHFTPYTDRSALDALISAPAEQWHGIMARTPQAPSRYGEDTNFALLESALDEMRSVEADPPATIIAGDFLAHEFPETFSKLAPGKPAAVFDDFVDKTVAFLALELRARFPHSQFVITIGNNDGYCGDYRSTPRSPFLAHFAQAWEPLVNVGGAAPGFAQTFPVGGYYSARLPTRGAGTIVSLNSVFWSLAYEDACGSPGDDPAAEELRWLGTAAAPVSGAYRWFLAHIPPAMDAYDSMRAKLPVSFLHDADAARLRDVVTASAPRTAAFVLGHTHHPSFAIFGMGQTAVPGIVIGSISPIQGNNPSFVTAAIEQDTGTILDTTTYIMRLEASPPSWTREYDARSAYGIAALDAPSLEHLQQDLVTAGPQRAAFVTYYTSSSTHGGIEPAMWRWYWCADDRFTSANYAACVAPAP